MTFRSTFTGGLGSLTALNRRIIAASHHEETSPAEEAEKKIIEEGTEESGYKDPDEDDDTDEETPEVRGRFVTEDPFEFQRIREWIELNIWFGETTGMTELIKGFINEWDVEYRTSIGLGPEDDIGRGATLERLLSNDDFVNGATWLPLTSTNAIPTVFESFYLDAETGVEVPLVAVTDPLTGVQFIEITETITELRDNQPAIASLIRSGSRQVVEGIEAQLRGTAQRLLDDPDIPAGLTPRFSALTSRAVLGDPEAPLPVITPEQLLGALTAATTTSTTRSTAGRREIAFDKNQLIDETSGLYNRWMLDPNPAPPSVVDSIVSSFINEATAFWSDKGGQLDFDTYVRGKLRELPRYEEVYRFKVAGQTEEQFIQSFMAPIAGLGGTGEFTRSQTATALQSGAGPAAQLQRVRRTRENRLLGGFSQRLAQTIQGLGAGAGA